MMCAPRGSRLKAAASISRLVSALKGHAKISQLARGNTVARAEIGWTFTPGLSPTGRLKRITSQYTPKA